MAEPSLPSQKEWKDKKSEEEGKIDDVDDDNEGEEQRQYFGRGNESSWDERLEEPYILQDDPSGFVRRKQKGKEVE